MRNQSPLRLAVIGLGWATRELHLPAVSRTRDFEVVATADPSTGLHAAFTDYREMLAKVPCDAVLVATPPSLHRAAALDALAAGCHVLLEKPIAANLEDALAIRDAARKSGRVCAMGFNQRCHAKLIQLRSRISRGELGTLRTLRAIWTTGSGHSARPWLGRRDEGGGALLDLGSHQLDLWRFLSGSEPLEVSAQSESILLDDEAAQLEAEFAGGLTASARLSLLAGDEYEIEVVGSLGRAVIRPYGRVFRASYDGQWQRFARAIREGSQPAASADDGIASLRPLLEAASKLRSAPRPARLETRYPLSVIASTPSDYGALRTTVAHLGRQTAVAQIELVLVGPTDEDLQCPEADIAPFAAVERVAVGPIRSIAHANASGVLRAHGRVVALSEDHCFPEPDWAAELLRAHEGPWAAVGPVVRNANPATLVSWADFLIGYGPWMDPMPAHSPGFLPGHNSSYKRDLLLELGGRLMQMLEAETVLHYEWTARGLPLRVEPAARVAHVNYSRWRSWIPVQVLCGRLFGGMRAAAWPRRRQLFFAAASPLIPAVRFWRTAHSYFKGRRDPLLFVRVGPVLAIGLILDGIGQMLGYLLGPGRSMEALARYEFNRIDHVRPKERSLWLSA